ncbi:hypothetical protein NC651_026000 [Populus alba x Populus x berolinensis]|nr:hypothetical protein NC651_026000 [Populus alba x Populus x berolinensis]
MQALQDYVHSHTQLASLAPFSGSTKGQRPSLHVSVSVSANLSSTLRARSHMSMAPEKTRGV